MTNHWKIISACLLVGVAIALLLNPFQPHYKGHPLNYWLERWGKEGRPPSSESARAIAAIGPSAIPFLLKGIRSVDTDALSTFYPLDIHLGSGSARKAFQGFFFRREIRRSEVAIRSAWAFSLLGERANSAVPALTEIVLSSPSEAARVNAAHALAVIGPAGTSPLLKALADPLNPHPGAVLVNIFYIPGADTNQVIFDSLKECLARETFSAKGFVASMLPSMHVSEDEIVPLIATALEKADNDRLRHELINALGLVGRKARPVAPQLLKLRHAGSKVVARSAEEALGKIAPDLLTNAPAPAPFQSPGGAARQ